MPLSRETSKSFSLANKSLQAVDRKVMKPVVPALLLQEDLGRGKRPEPLRFAVADPMSTAALLSTNGLGYACTADGRIAVSAKDATGVCVEFVKAAS